MINQALLEPPKCEVEGCTDDEKCVDPACTTDHRHGFRMGPYETYCMGCGADKQSFEETT